MVSGILIAMAVVGAVGLFLSLIHISEPTRRTPISYAVFCLKKKNPPPPTPPLPPGLLHRQTASTTITAAAPIMTQNRGLR